LACPLFFRFMCFIVLSSDSGLLLRGFIVPANLYTPCAIIAHIANCKNEINAKGKMNTFRFHWLLGIGYFAMTIEIGCWLLVILQFAMSLLEGEGDFFGGEGHGFEADA
jgi:hypothetical protein